MFRYFYTRIFEDQSEPPPVEETPDFMDNVKGFLPHMSRLFARNKQSTG
jgi:hypothetical protein